MKKGILLVNLGTPQAPTEEAVGRYLKQFLGDRRVISMPRAIWLPILHGIILKTRPKKSAKLYQSIWTDEGSPLFFYTKKQAQLLQELVPDQQVHFAMTYGEPKISRVLDEMLAKGVTDLTVLPLYPQYSNTTVAPIYDQINRYFKVHGKQPNLRAIAHFYDNQSYLNLLADKIKKQWEKNDYDMVLFSYHGVPVSEIKKGDPYEKQCQETTKLLMDRLGELPFAHTYQSKFGPGEWLTPATSETLNALPSQQVKKVLVVTPGFVSDCLETLEEIESENSGYFMKAGGEKFDYLHPFNEEAAFAKVLQQIACEVN